MVEIFGGFGGETFEMVESFGAVPLSVARRGGGSAIYSAWPDTAPDLIWRLHCKFTIEVVRNNDWLHGSLLIGMAAKLLAEVLPAY